MLQTMSARTASDSPSPSLGGLATRADPGLQSPDEPPLQKAVDANAHQRILIPRTGSFWRKFLAFSGPGYLVAVGYMDPGNWATDLAGGSKYGYTLLSVILLSNLMAVLLQALSAKLGIATGRDLAQACRDHYSRPVGLILWIICEIAIIACDLAEVIGAAIALNLLFKLPLMAGILLTTADVLLLLVLQQRGVRYLEAIIITLVLTVAGCFAAQLWLAKPPFLAVAAGFIPTIEIIRNPDMLYVALGILGATVMPHNLYLHSSIVQTRGYERTERGRREAVWFATLDSTVALTGALFVNAAILIVAGAVFGPHGQPVEELADAHKLLSPLLGSSVASTLFAVALLASGQSSTLTGTLAGQIVMEGFLQIRLSPWLRRLLTRCLAVIPAVLVIWIYGEKSTNKLLVLSQVILSLQLSFAVIPLVLFTGSRAKMGNFVNPRWLQLLAWLVALIIAGLNAKFLWSFVTGTA